ncbi:MAG TPA: MBL fold metallo-hydrolase [Candidatus Thermoplasmatota archaeon]|nr:MBL fold metallo-hydrolase [Candidatus Thermoplasmatota archaeon]
MKVETLGRGVLLPDAKLALDTSAPGHASVVSHAHGDHIPWEATRAWASPETADLLALRKPDLAVDVLPWREPTRIGRATVTLFPAGHVLGSAVTLVEVDGERLLYTGDTKTRPSLTAATAEYPEADVLVVESTFGLPVFRFPSREAIAARMADFARETIAQGEVPVFLGYALGKSQEILATLREAGVPAVAHGAVWNVCRVYERHGVPFDGVRPYAPRQVGRAALVVPDSFRAHPMVAKLDARIAYVSGWALLSKSRAQLDADCLVPLSDHADYPGLMEIVERVRPRRVLANHGYSDVLSHLLRKKGLDAAPLSVGHVEEDAEPDAQRTLDA